MALAAELSGHIDAGALVSTLVGALQGHAVNLNGIAVPDDGGRTGTISAGAQVDAGGIGSAVQALADQIAPQLAALAPQVPGLDAIVGALELVEQVSTGNLMADLDTLATQLGTELEGSREGGLVGVLMRVSALLSGAPVAGSVGALLKSLLGMAHLQVPSGVNRLTEVLPAADAALRAYGGLMVLESVLSESQRLTGVMAAQIDAPAVQRDLQALAATLDAALVDRIDAVDVADPAALQALAELLAAGARRFEVLREEVAAGIGLGEATLAYLDIDQVQHEMDTAAAMLRGIDLAPLGRLLADALGGLAPLTQIDIEHAPAQSLDALLSAAEGEIASQAARITAWDAAALAQPVRDGIDKLTAPLTTLADLITQVTTTLRTAMEAVRNVVSAAPVHGISDAIHAVLTPVTEALQLITDLVGDISAALTTASQAAVTALEGVEGTVDGFKADVEALFAQAEQFVAGLHLDQVAGQIGQAVAEFAAALERAQMKPYFDTAVSAIGGATDVVSKVPFSLLPASMKADVDAAVKPIKDTDVAAVETDIESALGLDSDGHFALRGDIEAALAEVQQKYDALMSAVRAHDPQQYLQQLDAKLQELAVKIRDIAPQLQLQPVQDAITAVKSAIAGLDLNAAIAPLQQVFDDALAKLAGYSPAQLIEPVEARVTAARSAVKDAIKLEKWSPALDDLSGRATGLLNQIDPARLQPQITTLLGEAQALLANLPATRMTWPGSIIAALLAGIEARLNANVFPTVQQWVGSGGAAAALAARTEAIAQAVGRTRDSVAALDIAALSAPALAAASTLHAALAALVGKLGGSSAEQARFQALADRYELAPVFSQLGAGRDRFLARLQQAATLVETVRRTGLSEVDNIATQLRNAFAPVLQLLTQARTLLRKIGVGDVDHGLVAMVRSVFEVLPPARLANLVTPLFLALRGRVLALLDAVLLPVKDAIARLTALLDAIDLKPLKDALQSVYDEVLADISALSPATLLAEPLAAFSALRSTLAAFDPLAPLLTLLDALRDTAARVVGKLSAEQLLHSPLAIYRALVDALSALDVGRLMAPVLDLVDSIGQQVDQGLDETVTAFRGLQAALPSGGGGSSVSVSVA